MTSKQDNILRDGTSQKGRYLSALEPEKVQVDGRDLKYYLRYAEKLSKIIRFYNRANIPYATWSPFFPQAADIDNFLATTESKENHPPQLALFLAFTRLMEILKADLNRLSNQHLNFYYKDVLRFREQKATPEKANVTFEIAPAATVPFILEENAELSAGNDPSGNPVIFTTDKELTLSKASISKLSTILVDQKDQSRVYVAPKADSSDGLAIPLRQEAPYWNPFGESQAGKLPGERTMVDGKVGFAIASPALLLREGARKIFVTVRCQNYRLTSLHFDAMRTGPDAVPEFVIDQLRPVSGILFRSAEGIGQAILDRIGAANVAAHGSKIMSHVTQALKLISDNALEGAFIAEATGPEGWFPVSDVITVKQLETELRFEIRLKDEDPAIVDYDPLIHKESIRASSPVIRFVLDHNNAQYLYDQLRGLKMIHVSIEMEVKGVRQVLLHTENGPANPAQPFLPFGAVPTVGSVFYFGSREVFSKKLDKLGLELAWANLPTAAQGFESYYQAYAPDFIVGSNDSFKASFAILNNRRYTSAASPDIFLFKTKTIDVVPGTHPLLTDIFTIDLPLPAMEPQGLEEITSFDPAVSRGFGRLMLTPLDFGHTLFPKIYAEKAILKATTTPAQALPNPPYTPKLSHFALNYQASVSFMPSLPATDGSEQLFHVQPLGLAPMDGDAAAMLLPQFPQGTLYIGLENVTAPQNISLLFQVVDGSADPDIEVSRDDVTWSYFDGDGWKEFNEASIPIDTTFGLQTSGIIEFSIGRDASGEADFWPHGLHWIAATFSKDPSGASKVVTILPNAVTATLRRESSALDTLDLPLPPEAINKVLFNNPLIKSVKQPFSSFSGKRKEVEIDFYRRVSERLRHRQRGVNLWDYEHLVLEAFPAIYKVKCLPHTGPGIEAEPGSVTLLVIPDLRKRNKVNPFEPKVSAVLRNQVRDYMTDLISGFSKVYVDNPHYEQVRIEMSVGLKPGFDGSFYGRLLNEELKRFLSPWAFEEGKDIVFGGRIFKSGILGFVENRAYVDYVTNFRLFHVRRGPGIGDMRIRDAAETDQDFYVRPDTEGEEMLSEIVAFSERSVLVTAPGHKITVLTPGEFVCADTLETTGIGAMIVEVDFFVF